MASVLSNSTAGSYPHPTSDVARQTWDRLAQVCGQYLGKGQQIAIDGRLQTRQWDDDHGAHHWKTEVVATSVEMLSGRRKRDYAADETDGETPVEDEQVLVLA